MHVLGWLLNPPVNTITVKCNLPYVSELVIFPEYRIILQCFDVVGLAAGRA